MLNIWKYKNLRNDFAMFTILLFYKDKGDSKIK